MKQTITRLYVGANNQTKEVDTQRLKTVLNATSIQGYTLIKAQGIWDGEPEPSVVVEIIGDHDSLKMQALAHKINEELEQDAVFITQQEINAQLVTGGVA